MTNHRSNRHDGEARTRSSRPADPQVESQAEPKIEKQLIEAERSGDWMPAEELHASAVAAASTGNDVALNLDRIDHLDASALQILLALNEDLNKRGHRLELAKASPHLRKWFEFAGADDHFFHNRAGEQ
jgi:anti-anti-sigma factor